VVELLSGAWGGQALHDGQEGVPNLGANVSNIPIEMLESSVPVRVERYGYVPDTGGSGQHRGGLSIEREYTFLGESQLSVRSDRSRILPYGIGAGRPGTPSQNLLETRGDEKVMPSKFSQRVTTGDRFYHRTAGAGGWGDPLTRDMQAVADDVRNGILSVERAFKDYAVIVEAATYGVDKEGTERERGARQSLLPGTVPAGMPTPLADRSTDSQP
jgi:N-methylhydantoinase B